MGITNKGFTHPEIGRYTEECRKTYFVPNFIETKCAVDIGANIGGFTNAYAKTFDKIYFFECNKEAFDIAYENTKQHDNVFGYNVAVSNTHEKLTIKKHLNNDLGSVSCSESVINNVKEWSQQETIGTAESITLEDVYEIANQHINFLKVDCENSEYEILMNQDLSKIDYIAMELHFQMGKQKNYQLLNHMCNWFDFRETSPYDPNRNRMFYFKNKDL